MGTQDACPICNTKRVDNAAVCPACGFRFLEQTQEFEPITIEDERSGHAQEPMAAPVLRSIRGPHVNTIIELDGDSLSVGRDPQCDIFLNDTTVSRRHATIEKTRSGYRITDENSFNGVWVNNESVASQVLKFGDIIQMGSFCFIFEAKQ